MFLKIKNIPKVLWSSDKPLNLKPKISTFFFLCIGLVLFGLGEGLLLVSFAGASPWSVLAQGISLNVDFSIGIITIFVSIGVLLLWLPLKQKPGIGTILNIIVISIVIDLCLPYLPQPKIFILQFFQVIIGVLIVGIGSGFYLIANLGPGPRDGLTTGFQKKTNLSFSLVRTSIEVSVGLSGWYLGGTVGIGTVVYALCIGPFVSVSFFFVGKYFK